MELTPAAGINPYITQNGKRYYLIGKEVSTGRWSGFTGGYEDKDKEPVNTAVRELMEESCNVFLPWKQRILDKIKKNECFLILSRTPRKRVLYAWFIEFPNDLMLQNLSEQFKKNRFETYDPHYLEKNEIKWVSEDDIFDENLGRGYRKDLRNFLLQKYSKKLPREARQ